MRASLTLTIRLSVMLAFLVLMPVLALPQVNRWVDDQFLATTGSHLKFGGEMSLARTAAHKEVARHEVASHASDSKKGISIQKNAFAPSQDAPIQSVATTPTAPVERLTPTDNEVDDRRFHELQGRFQRLGVQYLVLEKWPGEAAPYRFHCRMAVPGSSAYAQPFEARDVDPLRAMQQVLADVETWCASHSTTTSSKLR